MEFYIEEIKGFRAVGYKRSFEFENGENFVNIPLFWQEIIENGKLDKIICLMNCDPAGTIGICGEMREKDFDYYIAVSSDEDICDDLEDIVIETQSYAIFTCAMDKIQEVTKEIFSEWLPNSDYRYVDNAPELEIYPNENTCKICIPIMK